MEPFVTIDLPESLAADLYVKVRALASQDNGGWEEWLGDLPLILDMVADSVTVGAIRAAEDRHRDITA